ncbi:MAG: DUF1501 domain-containing protein [Flavisolibacter sp.]|nr:DUF1501 domain-containing protein [Flavisolibacter sp.]
MKRRTFLKHTVPAATLLPAVINGFSIKAFSATNAFLQAALLPAADTDHVLVIVQLTGGNDGLNTVIPISAYSDYNRARTNIAIPENKILKLDNYARSGLHPRMTGMQALYNEGKLAIVQAVGYPSPNFSHFRATDIWMSGSDSNQVLNTGWGGRYLDLEFPNYPTGYPTSAMPDPLAIQIGSITTLTCQGPVVNMGMSITDPNSFYNLVNGIQDTAPNTPMGNELSFIRQVAQQTNKYTARIKDAAATVTQQSAYPSNNLLAEQLKIVARLIKGGLKTRIYMVSYGGFDTHASQAVATDTTTGTHANLLGNVSGAIKAFMDDVAFLGIEERVIGMTFSEFGRRIKSNASGGTDHGAAAPMFLFGKNVVSGVLGNNPAIPANATVNDNIPFQYDFRSVYASVLQQWFCVSQEHLQMILLKNYQTLDLVNGSACGISRPNPVTDDVLIANYPNPFTHNTTITFKTKGGHTLVQVIDAIGQVLRTLVDKEYPNSGTYNTSFESGVLPAGVYYARLQNGPVQQVRTMLKVR